MKLSTTKSPSNLKALLATVVLVAAASTTPTLAFAPVLNRPSLRQVTTTRPAAQGASRLFLASSTPTTTTTTTDRDAEIQRLQSMAAQLRAEAAALEAQQRAAVATAAQRAFDKFDVDGNGELTLEELKAGLEKTWKMELPTERVQELLQSFDKSGDGVLQKEEMVKVETFRNQLDALVRQEKELARQSAKQATLEKLEAEKLQAALELINDGEPTAQDKIVSVLPYLFPLLDGLQFVGPLVVQHPDNVLAQTAAVAYALYRSIPFGGFLAFFALSTLSGNPRLNRLVRFNMQQAIFLDIALFAPALVATLINLAGSATGLGAIPEPIAETTGGALFAVMATSVLYAATSSLLGQTPDKIPFISQAVRNRLPNFEIMNMEGRILTKEDREQVRKELEEKQKNKDEDKSDFDKQ